MGIILRALMRSRTLVLLAFFHPRKFAFSIAFAVCLLPAYLFAGVFLGNGWPVVLGLTAVMAGVYTALRVKVSNWEPVEATIHPTGQGDTHD